jgi:hypothetical protein
MWKAFATVHRQSRSGNLSNQFADLLAQAGLRDKSPHRSKGKGCGSHRASNRLSFHSLRHTAVSLLKDAGIPEAVVMELVGHDSKAMSAHYTHVGAEALEKAVAALPEIWTTRLEICGRLAGTSLATIWLTVNSTGPALLKKEDPPFRCSVAPQLKSRLVVVPSE